MIDLRKLTDEQLKLLRWWLMPEPEKMMLKREVIRTDEQPKAPEPEKHWADEVALVIAVAGFLVFGVLFGVLMHDAGVTDGRREVYDEQEAECQVARIRGTVEELRWMHEQLSYPSYIRHLTIRDGRGDDLIWIDGKVRWTHDQAHP